MQLSLQTMDPYEPCRCKHPRYVHELGFTSFPAAQKLLKDAEKYCTTQNVCGKRTCPCCGFKPKEVA